MSTISTPAAALPVAATPPPAPVPAFYIDGDFPVYIFNGDQFQAVEDSGVNHYFVLANGKEKRVKAGTKDTLEDFETIKLWRVYSTVIGRAIVEATTALTGIKYSTVLGFHNRLPKIPFDLINRMDAFFRAVHKEHHSESIAMLVYDTRKLNTEDPSSGWGAVIPKQKNTAAFCDYDPTSVVEELEEEVILVGSAHSHPEMSAYASGTDHKDQADWDGIHITYGWKSGTNGGATEYYVETQYAGYKWARTLGDIAQMAPKPVVPKEEIDPWLANVTKGTAVVHHVGTGNYPKSTTTAPRFTPGAAGGSNKGNGIVLHRNTIKLPADAPNPETTTIVAVIDDSQSTTVCRFCLTPVVAGDLDACRCLACFNFIVRASVVGETVDFNENRGENTRKYMIEIDRTNATKPIVLWKTDDTFSDDFRIGTEKKE